MKTKTAQTAYARLYLSGPIEVAKQIIRAECLRDGLCVTVEPTTFIYTGGEEAGYVVGLVNYPKFPSTQEAITARASDLMLKLLDGTHQHSAMLVTPAQTEWVTKRPGELSWTDGYIAFLRQRGLTDAEIDKELAANGIPSGESS